MNQLMWDKAATQANIATLRDRGIDVLGPASGSQACGEFGAGRLLEADQLVAALGALHGPRPMQGLRVLVSAGPTYEDIDPVRFIGNRSSGRMGFAVAQAAAEMGAEVRLIAGPVHLPTPTNVAREDVRSAREMRDAVMRNVSNSDIFVSAAAVGDYRPSSIAPHKLKKSGGTLALDLVQNPDILAHVGRMKSHPYLVGFAAETKNVAEYARAKLAAKKIDLIAANQVGRGKGFDAAENELTLFWADGEEKLPRTDKLGLARALLNRVLAMRVSKKNKSPGRRSKS
jgi:phosphopantothenoylcysteine decarboxylase / phosphopantothenate---cysteine ligase